MRSQQIEAEIQKVPALTVPRRGVKRVSRKRAADRGPKQGFSVE